MSQPNHLNECFRQSFAGNRANRVGAIHRAVLRALQIDSPGRFGFGILATATMISTAHAGPFPPVFELSDLDGDLGYVVHGIDFEDGAGYAAAGGFDFNGDGSNDFAITAETADPGGRLGAGETYVVFGGAGVGANGTLELAALDGTNGFVVNGVASQDYSGTSVSGIDDFNGDGFADLLVGALKAGRQDSGKAYLILGGDNVGNAGSIELAGLDGSNG